VGWKAVDTLAGKRGPEAGPTAVLATAHPAKFSETVEPLTGPIPVPAAIKTALERTARAGTIPAELAALADAL
jgi:threonine synthase